MSLGQGWELGLVMCHFPARRWYGCRNTGFGPNFTNFLSPDRLKVKPYPSKQKKGGWKFAPKGLRGPVCWAKIVHFWKPWKHAFWLSPECQEPFSMLPRHTLSSFMVWNAGVGRNGQRQPKKYFWAQTETEKWPPLSNEGGRLILKQGCVIRCIHIIRRITFNAYFTVLNKLGRIIRLQSLPFLAVFGLFRQFPPH